MVCRRYLAGTAAVIHFINERDFMRLMPLRGAMSYAHICGMMLCVCLESTALAAPPVEDAIRVAVDPRLTLHDVTQQAFERYPRQQVIAPRGAQVDALRRQAGNPLAGPTALVLRHQTDRIGSRDGLTEWEGGVQMPLWLLGQKQARKALADQAGMGLQALEHALRLEVAGQVRERLWDVALMENDLTLTEQQWRAAQALEQDVRKRMTAGELAKVDLLLVQDETLRRQAQYLRAHTELKHALHRYEVLTGVEALPAVRNETPSTQTAVTDDHPLLADGQSRVAQAVAETQLAREERRGNPLLTLGARREQSTLRSAGNDSVGIALTLPLHSTAHAGPRLAASVVAQSEAQSVRDALKRELDLALDEAEHALALARAEFDLAVEQNRLAQENLRLMKKAFAIGEIDLVALLRVQTLAFAAERGEQQLGLQLQRDIARYNQAAGEIP